MFFLFFCKNWKIQNGRQFWGEEIFFENCQEYISQIACGSKIFDEIPLSHTIKEIEANLCFAIFGKNSKVQIGRHFWRGENFFKLPIHFSDTLWVENFYKITLSRTVKEIEANLCFASFDKNSKMHNSHHFLEEEIF